MTKIKTRYLLSKVNNKVYAFDDDTELLLAVAEHPEDIEILENEAYMMTFVHIASTMEKRFANYKNLDIMQECFYMMAKRFKDKGLFAPDKSYTDNVRIWWNYAKKSCLYIIRQHTNKYLANIDIWDIEDNETDTTLCLGKCDDDILEHNAGVQEILDTIDQLCLSTVYSEQQAGIYAKCKLQGLTDTQSCVILEIKMPRLYEIKRLLKEYFNSKFGKMVW